jgi:Domain of unknown function (DUF4118)
MSLRRCSVALVALLSPPLVALVALPLRPWLPSADIAAVLVAVVALLGSNGGRMLPVLAAVSAAVGFDLWWAEPYGTLTLRDPGDRLTGLVVLAVGAVLAAFCRRGRRRLRPVRWRPRPRVGQLDYWRTVCRVAENVVVGGDDSGLVALDVARTLVELLGLRDCLFQLPPFDDTVRPSLLHPGELELYGTRWDPVLVGLPPDGFFLPVMARGSVVARFACQPRRRQRVPRDCVAIALTLADQTASALLLEQVR